MQVVIATSILVATIREFAHRAQAQRVVVLADTGDPAAPLMLEWQDGTLEMSVGDAPLAVPDSGGEAPLPLGDLRPPPASAVHIHAEAGELHAPLGVIDHLAGALLDLAAALGGRSVAVAEWGTDDDEQPLTLAARAGEPVIVALGDEQFELPLS